MSYKCPACGHADPARNVPTRSNCSNPVTLEIPEHMVAAVAHAIMIGANTAMMSRRHEEEDYMREASAALAAQQPWAATIFDPHAWAVTAARIITEGDVEFEVFNSGSSWRPKWKISATAKHDASWPHSGRADPVTSSQEFDKQDEAEASAERLRDEAERMRPL